LLARITQGVIGTGMLRRGHHRSPLGKQNMPGT
jgi:hypothetical protein